MKLNLPTGRAEDEGIQHPKFIIPARVAYMDKHGQDVTIKPTAMTPVGILIL